MNRKKIFFIILTIFVILLVVLIQKYLYFSEFVQPVGALKTTNNEILRSHISTFMESKRSPYDLGHDNYHCSSTLYGYDDKYAYAQVYCSGFIVSAKNEVTQGTGFSSPIRFEYTLPDFKVINFKQPSDGDLLVRTTKKLFPEKLYESVINNPSVTEMNSLEQEVKSKIKVN